MFCDGHRETEIKEKFYKFNCHERYKYFVCWWTFKICSHLLLTLCISEGDWKGLYRNICTSTFSYPIGFWASQYIYIYIYTAFKTTNTLISVIQLLGELITSQWPTTDVKECFKWIRLSCLSLLLMGIIDLISLGVSTYSVWWHTFCSTWWTWRTTRVG